MDVRRTAGRPSCSFDRWLNSIQNPPSTGNLMRERAKARILWLFIGFVLGFASLLLYHSLAVWPFEDRFVFTWIRAMGKETIRWSYIAVIVGIVAFVVIQLFNIFVASRELDKKDNQTK